MSASSETKTTSKPSIGWIGTGVMGLSMCGHLLDAKYSVTIFSRTKAKAQALLDKGAKWADTPAAVAQSSDVIFTMLGFPSDVREVYFGASNTTAASLLSGLRSGATVIDMTTTEPTLAKEIYVAAKAKGAHAIDAPVSGGDVGARNATLSIMVGGEKDALVRVTELLQVLGKTIVHQGPAGSGQHTKMCNQIVIASTMVGVCESLLYGYKAGLDCETMLSSIIGGADACWTLNNLAPRVLKRDFEPGFFVDHFIKDMGIALDEAKRMKLPLPGLGLAYQLYVAVQAQGYGKKGTQGLMLALETISNTQVKKKEEEKNL
jgi:3-hydroxyisobutyrate dehydrogenase